MNEEMGSRVPKKVMKETREALRSRANIVEKLVEILLEKGNLRPTA